MGSLVKKAERGLKTRLYISTVLVNSNVIKLNMNLNGLPYLIYSWLLHTTCFCTFTLMHIPAPVFLYSYIHVL